MLLVEAWSIEVLIWSGWWFGTIDIFPYTGDNHPNWLIFFRGVGTTNQMCVCFFDNSHQPSSFTCLCLSKQSFGSICLLKPPPNLETANTRRCHGSKGCLEKTWARWCQLMVATNIGCGKQIWVYHGIEHIIISDIKGTGKQKQPNFSLMGFYCRLLLRRMMIGTNIYIYICVCKNISPDSKLYKMVHIILDDLEVPPF